MPDEALSHKGFATFPRCWAVLGPWLSLFALLDTGRSSSVATCACFRVAGGPYLLTACAICRAAWAGVRRVVSTTSASLCSHVRAASA